MFVTIILFIKLQLIDIYSTSKTHFLNKLNHSIRMGVTLPPSPLIGPAVSFRSVFESFSGIKSDGLLVLSWLKS